MMNERNGAPEANAPKVREETSNAKRCRLARCVPQARIAGIGSRKFASRFKAIKCLSAGARLGVEEAVACLSVIPRSR
jgi:hypothetical protein